MAPKTEACVFCEKIVNGDDQAEHVLFRGQTAYLALNRYPYNNGHLLVLPYAHVPSLENLPPETLQEMMLLVNKGLSALRLAMAPDGFNVGANLGELAGAGIKDHVHLHVVPRWRADTNFMTAVAETRTIPESLDQTYARLLGALAALSKKPKNLRNLDQEVPTID
ncbi:MAG: HIT domain-containing protein [Chloroflexota bacterium]|nr:HIT domain-containing protein [Chloroflexota bacterium]